MAKRERKNQNEDRPLWIKEKGGGTFRLPNGYRVKPQERFRAYDYEVPEAFRDTIRKIEESPEEKQEREQEEQVKQEVQEQEKFQIIGRGGPWYDVKTVEGIPMNDKALTVQQAEELKAELENGKQENNQEGETEET